MKAKRITGVLAAILLLILTTAAAISESKPIITFVELGSVNCIPCKKMQTVMKNVEENYGSQIKVIFHDIYKEKTKAKEYGIKLIPTQVFLDSAGKEFYRHEGFFPEIEIDKLLKKHGLKKKP